MSPRAPRTADLQSTGSLTAQLLRLAAPLVVMMVSRMAMTFVDVLMVARLGTEALAAISPAALFVMVLGCLGVGVAQGVQTYAAQSDGRGESRVAGAYAWQGFYIAVLFAAMVLVVAPTTPTWFGWVAQLGGHSPAVTAAEVAYIRIALWSIPLSIATISLNAFFTGLQRPWITAVAVIVSLAANILGNWIMIFGHLGCPALGIAGAAYSTVIAWVIRLIILLVTFLLPRFDQAYATRSSYALSRKKLQRLVWVGGPTAVQWLFDIGSWALFMVLIVPAYGTAAMAATNVGMQLMHLSFMPAMGIGMALCSQVGFAIGEGRPENAMQRVRVAVRLTATYMGLIGLLFWLAPEPLLGLFSAQPEVTQAGRLVLIWAAVFQVFDALAITYVNALRGAGDTRWPAAVLTVLCWVVFIGGGLAMAYWAPGLGLSGPWACCALYVILLGLVLAWRWRGGRWRELRLFAEEDEARAADAPATGENAGDETTAAEPLPATATSEP